MELELSQEVPTNGPSAMAQLSRRAQRLYSLPGAALKVIQLTSSADVSAANFKEAIETDPVLTAKILAVVNSSLFGQRERIVSLHRAIAILGMKPLRLLVLGLCLPRNLLDIEVDLLSSYWRMCLSKSVAAKQLSRRFYGGRLEDEVFIAALLQDIGMLILIQQLQAPYIELLTHGRQSQADVLEMETQAMGFNHTALSANLLEQWRLPASIVQAVKLPLHCDCWTTLGSDEQLLAEMLSWADLYGRFMAGTTTLWPRLQDTARRQWQLEQEELDEMLRELDDHVRALAVAFGVDARSWPDLTLLMQDAMSALSEAAEHSVREWLGRPSMQQALADMQHDDAPKPSGAPAKVVVTKPEVLTKPERNIKPIRTLNIDPQLGAVDPQLLARIATSADACRRARHPLSLVLCEVDRREEMVAMGGVDRVCRLTDFIERSIVECLESDCGSLPLGDARFAIVLENCDRTQSLQLARDLADKVRDQTPPLVLPGVSGVTLSIGVASLPVPPRNFAAEDLVAATHRCLKAALASGGNMIKSIDLM